MEFNFEMQNIFPGQITIIACDSDSSLRIYDVESEKTSKCRKNWTYNAQISNNAPLYKKVQRTKQQLENVIDEMGIASAKAQNLRNPITTLMKLLDKNQQRLYVMKDTQCSKAVIGILKVGVKLLFLSDENGAHYEVSSLCILDFYVHETKQRQGFGHILFNAMLKVENVLPEKLAIDRPSSKLLSFLAKHYGLKGAISQSNNFVVYPSFFHNIKVERNNRNATKHLQHSQGNANESEDLKQMQIDSDHFIRNRHVAPNTENLLQWKEVSNTSLGLQRSQSAAVNNKQNCDYIAEKNKRGNMNWGVKDAMHSYQEKGQNAGQSVTGQSFQSRPGTPVNAVLKNCQKWNQLDTSWNVLGVKPQDYSKFQSNNNISDLPNGIFIGRPS